MRDPVQSFAPLRFSRTTSPVGFDQFILRGTYAAEVAHAFASHWDAVKRTGGFPFVPDNAAYRFTRSLQATKLDTASILVTTSDAFTAVRLADGTEQRRWSTLDALVKIGFPPSTASFIPAFALPDARMLCFCRTSMGDYPVVFDPNRAGTDAFVPMRGPALRPMEARGLYATSDASRFVIAGSVETYAHHTEFTPMDTVRSLDLNARRCEPMPRTALPDTTRLPVLLTTAELLGESGDRALQFSVVNGTITARRPHGEGEVLWIREAPEVRATRWTSHMLRGGAADDGWALGVDLLDPAQFEIRVIVPS